MRRNKRHNVYREGVHLTVLRCDLLSAALVGMVLVFSAADQSIAQTTDPYAECGRRLSSPPLSQIEFNFGKSTRPIITDGDAVQFVGLVCSHDQIVNYFESYGWILERVVKYDSDLVQTKIDEQYGFCFPRRGWRRLILGKCAANLLVNALHNKLVGVGAFGSI